MRLTIVGAGYVGLATALALSYVGHRVVCVETNAVRLDALRRREDPLREPLLAELLASTDVRFVDSDLTLRDADAIVIAVGTPMLPDGHADLSQLRTATEAIRGEARSGIPVLVRSTVPVGTCDRLQEQVLRRQLVVSNPEFLREGRAVEDAFVPDRVVAGGPEAAREIVHALYEPILTGRVLPVGVHRGPVPVPFIWMDARSAELAKYAANGFLATKLSFVNEIANLAVVVRADARSVMAAMALDPRIGPHHLRPGLGWGGSCFPKDTRALEAMANGNGYEFLVLKAAIEQNRRQLESLAHAITTRTSRNSRIGLLGLAFKAGTADTRESPAVALAHRLVLEGRRVRAYDPMVNEMSPSTPAIEVCKSALEAATGADAVVVATEWPEFALLDLKALRGVMSGVLLFDGRTIMDPNRVAEAGLDYVSIV
jgi:UDPglucose 6-dehydrogenase